MEKAETMNKMKDILNQAKEVARKIAEIGIPILVYGTYSYLTQNNRRNDDWTVIFDHPDVTSDGLYGRAANAICSSDMSSYYKNQALSNLKREESDGYYEAVIAIANSRMSSFYRAESISNLEE